MPPITYLLTLPSVAPSLADLRSIRADLPALAHLTHLAHGPGASTSPHHTLRCLALPKQTVPGCT